MRAEQSDFCAMYDHDKSNAKPYSCADMRFGASLAERENCQKLSKERCDWCS